MIHNFFTLVVALLFAAPIQLHKLKPQHKCKTNVPEPSDITKYGNGFLAVSDNGLLFEIDKNGRITRKAEFKGVDFEAICIKDEFIYVSDETPRRVYQFKISDFSLINTFYVPFHGGNNSGFESLTFNEDKNKFILISEKPTIIHEYDATFQKTGEIDIKGYSDISSVVFYKHKIWVLSDEDMTVSRLNATDYKLEKRFKIPVLNPEGITFDGLNQMIICSDDLQTIYTFNDPQLFSE
jgi:uncharacterized protein YjiK